MSRERRFFICTCRSRAKTTALQYIQIRQGAPKFISLRYEHNTTRLSFLGTFPTNKPRPHMYSLVRAPLLNDKYHANKKYKIARRLILAINIMTCIRIRIANGTFIVLRLFVAFLNPSRKMPGHLLKLGHNCFLLHPFPFMELPLNDIQR